MKQNQNEYEVLIIGSGLAGLISAVLLAKENLSVLILREEGYSSSYQRGGYRFQSFSNFSEKRIGLNLLKRLSQRLDIPFIQGQGEFLDDTKVNIKNQDQEVGLQVILPNGRIDISGERVLFEREMEREFPKEVENIRGLYDRIENFGKDLENLDTKATQGHMFPFKPSSWRRWVSFDSFQKGDVDKKPLSFSKEFREFLKLQIISLSNLFSDRLPIASIYYLISKWMKDRYVIDIGLEDFNNNILEKFLKLGGGIEEIKGIERLELNGERGIKTIFGSEGRRFRSRYLILNLPLCGLKKLLSDRPKFLSKLGKRIYPIYTIIPAFIGIKEEVVPVGMQRLIVSLRDLGRDYGMGNLLFIYLSQKNDEIYAPEGKRALTVQSVISHGRWNQDFIIEHRKGVKEHLEYLFPFIEEFIEFIDWNWVEDHYSCWSYPHFIYETDRDFKWREGIIPTRLSERVYFLGKENFPYIGLEGEVRGGFMVGEEIIKEHS